eukprot:gene50-71_t
MAQKIDKIDRIDSNILQIIQNNAKITNLQLAETIGLSPASTLERVRRLETQGIIISYHAQLDRQKLGLGIHLTLQISLHSLAHENVAAFKQAIDALPEIVECHQVVGEADFFLHIITTNLMSYQALLSNHLSRLPGLKSIKTFTVLSTLKSKGLPIQISPLLG